MRDRIETSPNQVIVVIGMHRSGTSVVTRALKILGAELGDNVYSQSYPDNIKGHWEDIDVREINERLLKALALQWDVMGSANEAVINGPSLEPMIEAARILVRAKLSSNPIWAFKDPRVAGLWPFWRRVLFEESEFDTSFVWVVRRPWAVAQSLAHRNGFDSLKSHLLWLHHNLNPLEDVRKFPHVVVDYDRMIHQPRREITRIGGALKLELNEDAIEEFVEEFHDPDLRHFHSSGMEAGRIGAEVLADRAYLALKRVAGDTATMRDPQFLTEWNEICYEAQEWTEVTIRVNAQTLEERERGMRVSAEREREEARAALEGERGMRVSAEREREEARAALEGERGMRVSAEREREEARAALEGERGMRVSAEREREEARAALEGERGMRVSAEREREEARAALEGERGMRVSAEREREMRVALERGEARVALERERGMRVSAEREREQTEEARAALEREREDVALLHQALRKEKTTVFKPLLRRVYRLGVAVTLRMPSPIRWRLIRLKRSLWPTPASLNMESGHTGSNTGRGPALDTVDEVDLGQSASGCSDVLVFPVIDWDFRFQRSQHLSKQFAERGHRVFYLSTSFKTTDEPGFQLLRSPIPNLSLVQLCFPGKQPIIYQDRLEDETIEKFVSALNKLCSFARITNMIGIIALPFWGRLAEALPGCMMIYDCMDYHAGFSTNADKMIEEENRLLKRADLVITTSVELSRIVGLSASNTLIRNAGEIEYFRKIPVQLTYTTERPVVGYLGAIADWFDIDLVAAAARQYPEWDFVLVGSTAYCDISEAEALDNVKLIGEVPYTEAAGWVHSFDVALIPFKLNKLTLCTNPVKMYEYLAAGKPVVSTDLPEVRLVRDMVHVAESRERFIELLAVAMTECNDRQRAARRIEWAGKHDWAARYEQLENAIRGALPKVSVIVLTYNNLVLTKACLESLERNTHYPNWELILVDNASTDGTQAFLANYAAHNPHARLIQNESNRGFSAGNNQGLSAAGGEYFVILNNDTYVTEGWIAGLIRHLRQNPKLGLIGPVTNMIGNEAKIDINYTNMTEMQGAAWEYTSRHPGVELESAVVAFFCVGMPCRIHEIVGDLDERFGIGGFEDDDYCNRVRKAGFEIAIAEDVFIHHELSATSKLIDQKERQELFERNKAYYEQKWGPWIPHRYRDQNPEARDVDKS